jgi:hypothetical protein
MVNELLSLWVERTFHLERAIVKQERGKREDPVGATNHQPGLIIPPNNTATIAQAVSGRNQASPEKPHREWLIGFNKPKRTCISMALGKS